MSRWSTVDLVQESTRAHGVHDSVPETTRRLDCQVKSVTRSEFYSALTVGVKPEVVLKLTLAEDYENERQADFEGTRYEVLRTYETDDGGIELILERADGR